MKKIITLSLALVMVLALFTGCSNPVADELTKFLNTDMVEVNANYEKIKESVAKWENIESDEDFAKNIEQEILPVCEDSLTKVNAIVVETEEVIDVKAKYTKMMETYKEGFEMMLAAAKTGDEAKLNEANDKLSAALGLLDEYNAALESIAAEIGAEIEY